MKEKNNILFIGPKRQEGKYFGGIGVFSEALVNKIKKENEFQVFFEDIYTGSPRWSKKLKILKIVKLLIHVRAFIKEVKTKYKDKEIQIIHYNTSRRFLLLKDLFILVRMKRMFNAKTVIQVHYSDIDKILIGNKYLDRYILRIMNNHIDTTIFLSNNTYNEFLTKGLDNSRAVVLYNFHNYTIDQISNVNNETDMMNKELTLTYIGSIDKRKGILDIFQALDALNFNFRFNICGSFIDSTIENEVTKKLQDSRYIFHGYVDFESKTDLLRSSHLLLLPSYGEGMPLVILEAMANQCAIVSTYVGGIPEVITNNGCLLKPGDVKGISMKLTNYNFNREKLIMEMKNSTINSKNFTLEHYYGEIASLYKEVINQ